METPQVRALRPCRWFQTPTVEVDTGLQTSPTHDSEAEASRRASIKHNHVLDPFRESKFGCQSDPRRLKLEDFFNGAA